LGAQVRRFKWRRSLVLIALAAGLPLGIVGSRWAWGLFADQLGIERSSTVATTTLLLTIPATLLLTNAIAAFPGRAAARIRPAVALRAE
jgi:hypothetical protein